jgi:hypothetical protein
VDVTQGSMVVSSPANVPEDAVDVVVGMGIYNPTKATCGGGCQVCNGYVSMSVDPGSGYFWVAGTQQFAFRYTDNLGWQYDVSRWSTWGTDASGVAGVQTAGQPNPGLASGVGVGTAHVWVGDPDPVPVNTGGMCMSGMQQFCPMLLINASAPVTVAAPCDLTIGSPANGQVFDLGGATYNQATIPLNATSACSGSVSWAFNWSYTLINGGAVFTSSSSTSTTAQQNIQQNTNYTAPPGNGGMASVSVSATLGGVPLAQFLAAYVDGTTIPNAAIVSGLTRLYSGGATPTLLVGIAFSESSCSQFTSAYNRTYQVLGAWPLESASGAYVGMMQVQSISEATLFDWTANAQAGYGIFQAWLAPATSYSQQEHAQYPQLPLLSAAQLEDDALWLYAGFGGSGHYYLPNSSGTGWVVTSASQSGVSYVAKVRAHASLSCN